MMSKELDPRKLLGFRLLTASSGAMVGAKIGNKNNAPPIASKIGGKVGVKGASPVT